ncbi:hypothetical protein J0895_24750 [Phormidium pseudopriestleyi FRX01]|uniref:Uncharacterized protein n=2 Tax=Phormidium TaxID=1198 RepID=A0ABS3FYM4_9CYAN|nr:hypothetical protein [Phormidium pseudopriestleyi]MBO0352234.1 hypothetical protein [Phormidium pseudopriestleyi FRX01]
MENSLFNQTFRDNEGNIVIAQPPNLPMLVGITTTLLTFVVPSGNLHTGLDAIAFGSWFTWAWLEIFDGVNYFRRALGVFVLIAIIADRVFNTF